LIAAVLEASLIRTRTIRSPAGRYSLASWCAAPIGHDGPAASADRQDSTINPVRNEDAGRATLFLFCRKTRPAVDQTGIVLDVLVQRRRDKQAAKRLLRKLLKKQMRPPRVMITDKLASYGAAKREVMPGIEHRHHKGLNNRAENSHQPTRRRERQMKQFKSAGQAQRSSQPTIRSTTSSTSAAITSLPPSTELSEPINSRSGLKSAVSVGSNFYFHCRFT
jgi:hypothetical protein